MTYILFFICIFAGVSYISLSKNKPLAFNTFFAGFGAGGLFLITLEKLYNIYG